MYFYYFIYVKLCCCFHFIFVLFMSLCHLTKLLHIVSVMYLTPFFISLVVFIALFWIAVILGARMWYWFRTDCTASSQVHKARLSCLGYGWRGPEMRVALTCSWEKQEAWLVREPNRRLHHRLAGSETQAGTRISLHEVECWVCVLGYMPLSLYVCMYI